MWLCLVNHLAHVAESVQHLCPHEGSAVIGHANSREAFLSADASVHLPCVFSSKHLYQWQGLRLPVAVAFRRQGKVMQVLVAARSQMCLRQGTVVQMLQ